MSRRRLRASIRADRVLTDEECAELGPKSSGIISLTALSVKLRLWESRTLRIEEMAMPQLEEAERNLEPFVKVHQRIEARLEELRHGDARAR